MWESLRTKRFKIRFLKKKKGIKNDLSLVAHKLTKNTLATPSLLSQTFRKILKSFLRTSTAKRTGGAYA